MDRRRAGEPRARFDDRLHHHRGIRDPQPGPATFFGQGQPDIAAGDHVGVELLGEAFLAIAFEPVFRRIIDGKASGRERVCKYVWISVVAVSLKKKKKKKK